MRADASPAIGGGHVMRCFALAERLGQSGWQPSFAVRPQTLDIFPALSSSFPIMILSGEDEASELRRAAPDGCDLLIVDHYSRDADFERACRPWARAVMVIDDLADRPHDADLLLDQTPTRQPNAYAGLVPAGCRRLTGADYALLRPEFAKLRSRTAVRSRLRSILLAFGASDPSDTTSLALQAVLRSGLDVQVDGVIGSADTRGAELKRMAAPLGAAFRLHQGTSRMAELAAAADLAIGAGGVSALERCCLGLPSLIIQTADNQRMMASSLATAGAIIDLGPVNAVAANSERLAELIGTLAKAPDRLSEMSRRAFAVCDGRGPWRVALALLPEHSSTAGTITLRLAAKSDTDILFAWQTPAIRRFSRNSHVPSREQHVAWLAQVLADPDRLLMIIETGGKPAGVLRLDGIDGTAEVSITVAPERYGQGIGRAALALAAALLPQHSFAAFVHPDNRASHALFRASGYHAVAPNAYRLTPRTDDARR